MPTKIIKENSDIFGDFIFSNFNCWINISSYPSLLKRADITPVHKKDPKSKYLGPKKDPNICRPVVILSNTSKLYERIMFKQTSEHFQSSLFSKYHCRFKKCFSAQHCLVSILEK